VFAGNFERYRALHRRRIWEPSAMRGLIALVVIIYLVGVGVVLAPAIEAKWNTVPASDFAASLGQALPYALAWPARVYRSVIDRG